MVEVKEGVTKRRKTGKGAGKTDAVPGAAPVPKPAPKRKGKAALAGKSKASAKATARAKEILARLHRARAAAEVGDDPGTAPEEE